MPLMLMMKMTLMTNHNVDEYKQTKPPLAVFCLRIGVWFWYTVSSNNIQAVNMIKQNLFVCLFVCLFVMRRLSLLIL